MTLESHSQNASALVLARAHVALTARLRERLPEIEQAAITRLYAVSEPSRAPDPEYMDGLRTAIRAALEYLLAAVELGEERSPPPPPTVLVQARLAARCGVTLDTVLRRCFAGYTLFGDFLMEEAEDDELLKGAATKCLLRGQAALFDRLVTAVTEEYGRELPGNARPSSAQRHAELIQRLLRGERLDAADLGYELEAHHLGLIAAGPRSSAALRRLAKELDRRLLLLPRGKGETAWAWLGGREPADPEELDRVAAATLPPGLSLAVGEPGQGLEGWRLTHAQARAALPIALRSPESFARYAEVALIASMLQDELLVNSLRRLYLDPLGAERDGGELLRKTLRAYFVAERNVSSAAAALSVKRHTVTRRLRRIEEYLGRPLSDCAAEVEAAMRIEDVGTPMLPYTAFSRA